MDRLKIVYATIVKISSNRIEGTTHAHQANLTNVMNLK